MSLINQMLQELEKRHVPDSERGMLPSQVRVLPDAKKSGASWWLLGIGITVALGALFAWQLNNQPAPLPPAPVARVAPLAPPPSEAPTPAPPPAVAPMPAPAPSADSGSVAPPSGEPRAAASPKETAPQPKPSRAVEKKPKTPSASMSASVKPAEIAARPTVVAAKPTAGTAKEKTPEMLASVQIDKRPHQLTSQQLAENEYRNAANLLNQDRLAEAQEGFRLALKHDPRHTGARQGLFGLLLEAKKNGEAEQVLRDGLVLDLNQPGFAMALARLQVDRGDTVSAIETMQRSASTAQGSPDYLAFHAALLQRQLRHQQAVDHYLAALRLAPGSGVWLMGLGISLHALNRNPEAQDAFRRAKATNTLNPELQAFVEQRLRQLE